MHDRVDLVLARRGGRRAPDRPCRPDDEHGLRRNGPAKPGRKVVENDDLLAGIMQLQDHVAADIAGAARHQNRHRILRISTFEQPSETLSASIQVHLARYQSAWTARILLKQGLRSQMDRTLTARSRSLSSLQTSLTWLNDEAHPQSRPPGRRPRHPVSSRHQGDAEGDDDRRRPARRAACRRRGEGGGNRAFHLRHRPEQGGHRGPFRHRLRAQPDFGEPRQNEGTRSADAGPAPGRPDELHAPAGAPRPRPCRLVRPRDRRRRALRGAPARHAEPRRRMAQMLAAYDRHGGNIIAVEEVPDGSDPPVRHRLRRARNSAGPSRSPAWSRNRRRAPPPRTTSSPAATSCSPRSSKSSRPRSKGAGGEIQLTDAHDQAHGTPEVLRHEIRGADLRHRLEGRLPRWRTSPTHSSGRTSGRASVRNSKPFCARAAPLRVRPAASRRA